MHHRALAEPAVLGRLARPHRLPLVTIRRREEWLRRRTELMEAAQIHDEQSFLVRLFGKISQDKRIAAQDRAIDAARPQFTKPRVALAKLNEIAMQMPKLRMTFALVPIQLRPFERAAMIRHR